MIVVTKTGGRWGNYMFRRIGEGFAHTGLGGGIKTLTTTDCGDWNRDISVLNNFLNEILQKHKDPLKVVERKKDRLEG